MATPRKILFVRGRPCLERREARLRPASRRDYEPGRSLPGGFVVDEIIAEGGSGLMLKAHKPAIQPPIYKAIKVINTRYLDGDSRSAEDVQREFHGEAKVSFEIGSDPYAVSVEDILAMPDGSRALVYPFVKGQTVHALNLEHLRRGWLFPVDLAAFVFHRILCVLSHAAERGIAHRDLCTNNIMVQRTGVPLLLDWGAATEGGDIVVGKPAYMAPELLEPEAPLTREALHRADMFSLGAVLRELLTGFNALDYAAAAGDGDDVDAAFKFRRDLDTDRLPPVARLCADVPAQLSDIVYTCMKMDPLARPCAEDLYDYLGSEYLYTPQVGFGPTVETLRDYLSFLHGGHEPAAPLPDTRLGHNLARVIGAKFRRKAEAPEFSGLPLAEIARRQGVEFVMGAVGRTFAEAFGRGTAEDAVRAAAGADAGREPDADANLRAFRQIVRTLQGG